MATNYHGLLNLLSTLRNGHAPPLIAHVSTAANVGVTRDCCVREEDGCRESAPHHNDYTRSKAAGERLVLESGFPYLIIRPSIAISRGLPNRLFARQILWFMHVAAQFSALPIDPNARIDAVPVAFVVESLLQLLRRERRHAVFHISSGVEASVTANEMNEVMTRYYGRRSPLVLIRPEEWCRHTHRRHVRGRAQRRLFGLLKCYFPFINMNVVYDNSRLRRELGDEHMRIPKLTEYCEQMLDLVTLSEATERN